MTSKQLEDCKFLIGDLVNGETKRSELQSVEQEDLIAFGEERFLYYMKGWGKSKVIKEWLEDNGFTVLSAAVKAFFKNPYYPFRSSALTARQKCDILHIRFEDAKDRCIYRTHRHPPKLHGSTSYVGEEMEAYTAWIKVFDPEYKLSVWERLDAWKIQPQNQWA